MAGKNLATYYSNAPMLKRRLWFPGTTAIRKGMGLCYDLDVAGTGTGETATDAWGRRGNSVAVPDTTNNLAFAGVSSQYYPANTNGQLVDIYEPGGMAEIAIGLPTSIKSTILTCSVNTADAGRFTLQGLPGRGTALALQTLAADAGSAVCFSSLDGTATTSWDGTSVMTISKSGIGTACGYGDSAIDPTEFVVVVLGGADDATGGDSSGEMATTGAYAIVTAPTADTITIATDIGDVDVTLYVIKNNYPTILAYLMDGDESGLQETISPQDEVTTNPMVGGTTLLCLGYTIQADTAGTLAAGLRNGQRKLIGALGTSGGNDWVLTVADGIDFKDGGACASIPFDTKAQFLLMEWNGMFTGSAGQWQGIQWRGVTIAG